MKPLVYSVEDDLNIQNVINIALTNSNFEIVSFENAKDMISTLDEKIPDLFLLDIMLPDIDGLQILKKLKANPKWDRIPVMIISAKITEIDRVIGLDMGADDYLIKPFGVLELVSRVKALVRRYRTKESNDYIEIKGLYLNPKKFSCKYNDVEITMTIKQFELLHLLMRYDNEIVTRDEILNKVWGYEYIGESRTIDVHIKEIRRKLKEAGLDERAIETIRGIGYRFIL